jgi:hypothetical protein
MAKTNVYRLAMKPRVHERAFSWLCKNMPRLPD